jgi:hypothetical protein
MHLLCFLIQALKLAGHELLPFFWRDLWFVNRVGSWEQNISAYTSLLM